MFDHYYPHEAEGCHLWRGPKDNRGYGLMLVYHNYALTRHWAHRFSWERHNGPIPEGMCILHSCDTPLCVNPKHLRAGTKLDNIQDAVSRGRNARGTMFPQSKLTEEKVRAIRAEFDKPDRRPYKQIAAEFGVHEYTIGEVGKRQTWAWVK